MQNQTSNSRDGAILNEYDALCYELKEIVYKNLFQQINVLSDGFAKNKRYDAVGGLNICSVADAVWELAARVLIIANPGDEESCLAQYDLMADSLRRFTSASYAFEKEKANAPAEQDNTITG